MLEKNLTGISIATLGPEAFLELRESHELAKTSREAARRENPLVTCTLDLIFTFMQTQLSNTSN